MRFLIIGILGIVFLFSSCKKHEHNHDHNKSNNHMHQSSFDELLKRFESKERDDWQKPELVIEKLGDITGMTIGDIGSGTGYFSFRLANQGANVVAIDVDKRFVDFIEQKIAKEKVENVTTKLVGYDNPELNEGMYDVLIIVNTYHHFNKKIEYLNYCFKGLKKGGRLINIDFKNKETAHGPPVDHRIAAEQVTSDLSQVGFVNIEIDQTTLPEQYTIVAYKK